MSIRLSARLQAIAELVPKGARVIDVGTDHAMIPVWLAQEGRASHVWASDLRAGPLDSAKALINSTGTGSSVETKLTDGLCGFGPDAGDTVIIAGMGGETMVSILSSAPWTRKDVLLILSPQSKQEILRGFLVKNGYSITHEGLVEDGGHIYPVITACGGNACDAYSRAELCIGSLSRISKDPLFHPYLKQWIARTEKAAPYDREAKALLDEFLTMEARFVSYAESR